ncbi:MAG: UPF0280 family protein [Coriobacteriia bacterium]|nr:UPF0280 family protein [Coriobacteriia bacterium]
MAFEPRTYRRRVAPAGLVTFQVMVRETDLQIAAECDLTREATALVEAARAELDGYISHHRRFVESFVPFQVDADAPAIVRAMAAAASIADVGPMAAVAGAFAEHVARGLAAYSAEVVVENGGDVYMTGATERVVALHAGPSPLSGRVGIVVDAATMPVAVCTSSASVGPSVSLGSADAACVIARDGALADAVASALGNRVHSAQDVQRAIDAVKGLDGVLGLVVVAGETLGAWGAARLVSLDG